ncbi:hypothetical protein [Haladaptatus caseinilyticus]|uniref:hypothetical protein n=1 Tax=Haladaptatus caseinilyticus TaxID=2993314 RepID=UPI00224B2432|nr:hypothetical protein [Haladaptatus caseinilyticus]
MTDAVISGIDHILIRVEHLEPLFSTLTEVFGLPSPWPLSTHSAFTSVGVSLGNVDLELVRFGKSIERRPNTRLYGIAFEPNAPTLMESQRVLQRRGIPHSSVVPYIRRNENGNPEHLWDSLYVGGLLGGNLWQKIFFASTKFLPNRFLARTSDSDVSAVLDRVFPHGMTFLVDYDPAFAENFEREEARRKFDTRNGGPLGVVGLREIVIGTKHTDAARDRWSDLLWPVAESTPNRWRFDDGLGIRLVSQSNDGFVGLVVEVESLDQAKALLATHDMVGNVSESSVTIAPSTLAGVDIRLVESAN